MHTMSGPETATLCSKCSANVPEGSQFCPKCAQPTRSLAKGEPAPDLSQVDEAPLPPRRRSRRRRSFIALLVFLAFIGLLVWTASSDNPTAQSIQELFGWKRDQVIVDTPFSVAPHNIQYFKFSLPEGSVNVSIVGDFAAATDSHDLSPRKTKDKNPAKDSATDDNIEVFVLTEAAFTVWQSGYSTGSLYESGQVSRGKVQADLPAGAGIYYLVFNNKFAPRTAKRVEAAVFLRYRNWVPESIRRLKARVMNWFE